jgi:hypothetical protein
VVALEAGDPVVSFSAQHGLRHRDHVAFYREREAERPHFLTSSLCRHTPELSLTTWKSVHRLHIHITTRIVATVPQSTVQTKRRETLTIDDFAEIRIKIDHLAASPYCCTGPALVVACPEAKLIPARPWRGSGLARIAPVGIQARRAVAKVALDKPQVDAALE